MVIRHEQIEAFREPMARDLNRRMCARLRSRFRDPLARTNEEELAQMVNKGIDKSNEYGIKLESDIGRFLDFIVEYGSEFDAKPWARPILTDANLSGSRKMDIIDDIGTFNLR